MISSNIFTFTNCLNVTRFDNYLNNYFTTCLHKQLVTPVDLHKFRSQASSVDAKYGYAYFERYWFILLIDMMFWEKMDYIFVFM